ncbi:MAG: serine/threonine protein kinase, partial [Proteobacteria bacterium]|nr:serine/threonine protein kinase [Pseudomonadota bacterium]
MSYNPGDVLKERYVIKEVLGKGSMGEVYRAEHVTIHRMFAIKLMHVHIAEKSESLARFRREANAAAQLDHPHICQVTDFDSTENGDFYLVMEYLKGETLRDRLEREGTIEIKTIFRIMNDLLGALECAHEAGIVHRDIKPENISLINREDRDDYVKLIDFGIAHADKPNDEHGVLTQSGQVYGTPEYLSPEQVMGNPVDLRADLYSCGCMLFEMIEGEPPFNGKNYILLLNKHLVVDPPHLTKEFNCAQELDAVIQKLLMKHPEDRYSSAREVRTVLSDIASRYFPELNLGLSQSGGANPSQPNLQSNSSGPASNGENKNSNEEPPKKKIGKIAIAGVVVFILLAVVLLSMFVNQNKANDSET